MGRLIGGAPFYGTKHGICIYRMRGRDFVRAASSLTAKRVLTDPAFAATRQWADRLRQASVLAAAVYDMFPPSKRKFRYYRRLTGIAMRCLKQNMTPGEAVVTLMIHTQRIICNRSALRGKRLSETKTKAPECPKDSVIITFAAPAAATETLFPDGRLIPIHKSRRYLVLPLAAS
ncbi:MAG: hypothetical protein JST39_09560 [Bacteroidetes bacterium]|nr:hypothetical protein [Bacteroidota bacterium]